MANETSQVSTYRQSFYPTGVSPRHSEYTADRARRYFGENKEAFGPDYTIVVEEDLSINGLGNVTMRISPNPWGEDGPYSPKLADAIIGWAAKLDPYEAPNPADYLLKVPSQDA